MGLMHSNVAVYNFALGTCAFAFASIGSILVANFLWGQKQPCISTFSHMGEERIKSR